MSPVIGEAMSLAEWSDRILPEHDVAPWWPAVEPTPRWIRVRVGGELIADSRRALLLLQYRGPRQLPARRRGPSRTLDSPGR
jgi:hypothetical protein